MIDGIGWVIVLAALVFLAWGIIKGLFRLALLGGILLLGLIAGVYFLNQ